MILIPPIRLNGQCIPRIAMPIPPNSRTLGNPCERRRTRDRRRDGRCCPWTAGHVVSSECRENTGFFVGTENRVHLFIGNVGDRVHDQNPTRRCVRTVFQIDHAVDVHVASVITLENMAAYSGLCRGQKTHETLSLKWQPLEWPHGREGEPESENRRPTSQWYFLSKVGEWVRQTH